MAWDRLFRVPLLGGADAPLRRVPGRHAARAWTGRLRAGEAARARREPGRHLPRGQALARRLDGARAAAGRRAARARDRGAALSGHDPRGLPRLALLPRAAGAGEDPRALPRPDRPRRLTARSRGTRRSRRSSWSCARAWTGRCCPASRPTARSRRSTGRARRGRGSIEAVPALGLALFVFWKTRELALVWPCYAYIGYLLLDLLLLPQRRLTKWIRNGSAAVFIARLRGLRAAEARPARAHRPSGARGAPAGRRLPLPLRPRAHRARLRAGPGARDARSSSARSTWPRRRSGRTSRCRSTARPTPGRSAASSGATRHRSWRPTPSAFRSGSAAARELLPHALAGLLAWGLGRLLPGGGGAGAEPDAEDDAPSSSTLGLRD